MASEEPFGGDYLFLKPEEATLLDLGRFLFSPDLNNIRFIECPQGLEAREFRQRWLLFTSVVVQMVLIISRKSLKHVGDMLELWLNRLSSNGGLMGLLINILKGSFHHFFLHHYNLLFFKNII